MLTTTVRVTGGVFPCVIHCTIGAHGLVTTKWAVVSLVIQTRDPQSIQGERMNTLRLGYGGRLCQMTACGM